MSLTLTSSIFIFYRITQHFFFTADSVDWVNLLLAFLAVLWLELFVIGFSSSMSTDLISIATALTSSFFWNVELSEIELN